MGKNNLLLGTARGKLGDVIFYRTGGEQRFRVRVKPTNPRTNAQLIQRAVVATAVKAYSGLQEICNHAFQNYEGNLKNQERFMKLNIKMLREIALQNVISYSPIRWTSQNYGNYVMKDDTKPAVNNWIIAEGDLPSISVEGWDKFQSNKEMPYFIDNTGKSPLDTTWRELINSLGLNAGDQITFIWISTNKPGIPTAHHTTISRIILMPDDGNLDSAFTEPAEGASSFQQIKSPNKENYGNVYFQKRTGDKPNELAFVPSTSEEENYWIIAAGIIVSRYERDMWRRSDAQLTVRENYENVLKLTWAVDSYMKADTSSLYLNQATTVAQTEAASEIEQLKEIETAAKEEEETKQTKKK